MRRIDAPCHVTRMTHGPCGTHCNTLRYTTTHCNTLQHIRNTLLHTACHTHDSRIIAKSQACPRRALQQTATDCNRLHTPVTHCYTLHVTRMTDGSLRKVKLVLVVRVGLGGSQIEVHLRQQGERERKGERGRERERERERETERE